MVATSASKVVVLRETLNRKVWVAAARMGRLVDDLLAFSRMGRAEMLCKDVNLDDLLREVVQEAGHDTGGRTIRWR